MLLSVVMFILVCNKMSEEFSLKYDQLWKTMYEKSSFMYPSLSLEASEIGLIIFEILILKIKNKGFKWPSSAPSNLF